MTAVFPLIATWPLTHDLTLENHVNEFGDGYELRLNVNQPYTRADGQGSVTSYKGRNTFNLKFKVMDYGGDADDLWSFYQARLGALESFYWYNVPDERATIDPTGLDPLGRYLVRFADSRLSREKFILKLYSGTISLIEVRS